MLVRAKCVYTCSAELCLDLRKLELVRADNQTEFRQERLKEFFCCDCGIFNKWGGLGLDLGFLDSSRKAVPFSMLWIRSLTCLNQPETRVPGKWKSWLQRSRVQFRKTESISTQCPYRLNNVNQFKSQPVGNNICPLSCSDNNSNTVVIMVIMFKIHLRLPELW